MNAAPRGRDIVLLALILAVGLGVWRSQFAELVVPRADALRYLEYSTNLLEHGVFGLGSSVEAGAPGRANMPLYPAFLALVFKLNKVQPADLRCYLEGEAQNCDERVIARVVDAQTAFVALTLIAIWRMGWQLFGARGAWLAMLAGAISGQPGAFATQLLTENLILVLFAWLGVFMLLARAGARRWHLAIGVALGALTLTRPEFAYLAWAFIAVYAARAAIGPARAQRWQATVTLVAAIALLCGPWMVRNIVHFDDAGLTASYGGRILAQRVQYNRMSNTELGVAFVYWLPDFGDSLARRLFTPESYARLDFGPDSYYSAGMPYHDALAARLGSEDAVPRALLMEDIASQPFKHAAVTVALAWRAVFVGKLWGLIALIGFFVAFTTRPALRAVFLQLAAPAVFMLALYAAVSVSIPRYAVCFVPLFAVCWASLFQRLKARA